MQERKVKLVPYNFSAGMTATQDIRLIPDNMAEKIRNMKLDVDGVWKAMQDWEELETVTQFIGSCKIYQWFPNYLPDTCVDNYVFIVFYLNGDVKMVYRGDIGEEVFEATELSTFTAVKTDGVYGDSAVQTFTLTGTGLTSPNVTITPPARFKIKDHLSATWATEPMVISIVDGNIDKDIDVIFDPNADDDIDNYINCKLDLEETSDVNVLVHGRVTEVYTYLPCNPILDYEMRLFDEEYYYDLDCDGKMYKWYSRNCVSPYAKEYALETRTYTNGYPDTPAVVGNLRPTLSTPSSVPTLTNPSLRFQKYASSPELYRNLHRASTSGLPTLGNAFTVACMFMPETGGETTGQFLAHFVLVGSGGSEMSTFFQLFYAPNADYSKMKVVVDPKYSTSPSGSGYKEQKEFELGYDLTTLVGGKPQMQVVLVTIDFTNGTMALYWNGSIIAEYTGLSYLGQTHDNWSRIVLGSLLTVGGSPITYLWGLKGYMHAFNVFNSKLSASDIAKVFTYYKSEHGFTYEVE